MQNNLRSDKEKSYSLDIENKDELKASRIELRSPCSFCKSHNWVKAKKCIYFLTIITKEKITIITIA